MKKLLLIQTFLRNEVKQRNVLASVVQFSRLAMTGFVSLVVVELVTGKGLLENTGFTSPFPTLALVGIAVVGILTAFLISQSVASTK